MRLQEFSEKHFCISVEVMHPAIFSTIGIFVGKIALEVITQLGNIHLKSETNIFTWVIIFSLAAGGLSSLWILKPRLKMGVADKLFYFLHAGVYFALALYGVIVEICYR